MKAHLDFERYCRTSGDHPMPVFQITMLRYSNRHPPTTTRWRDNIEAPTQADAIAKARGRLPDYEIEQVREIKPERDNEGQQRRTVGSAGRNPSGFSGR
jgi:hypothetical protein